MSTQPPTENQIDRERLINDMIKENSETSIRDYLDLLEEINGIR